jgi:hypothetical protein
MRYGAVGLHGDAQHAAFEHEIVDVHGREHELHGGVDIADGEAHRLGLFAIERELELRRWRHFARLARRREFAGAGLAQQRAHATVQRRPPHALAVLEPELEAAEVAETGIVGKLKKNAMPSAWLNPMPEANG